MKQSRLLHITIGAVCLCILMGCGDIRPLWKGEAKLESLTLYFSEPIEFTVEFPDPDPPTTTMLEIAITYDQGINRTNLPLFLTLEDPSHQVQEFSTDIVLKEEGEWLGIPEENEIDYTVTHIAVKGLLLESDSQYQLKIFADDDNKEKIYGIIRLAVRLYRQADFETE